jgi:phage terminase large subunit
MRLTKKQTKCLDYLENNKTTDLLYGGGAGGGKSVVGCFWAIKMCLKYPGIRGLIGRANLKTLKETTLQSFFEVAKLQGLKAGVHYTYNQQSSIITFYNGSAILLKDLFLYPSDPNFDELGSLEITFAFIDEVNQIVEKAWNIVKSRIRFKLDENNLIPKILGTCNPSKGWVYKKFYKPYKEGVLDEKRVFIPALVTDNSDNISAHYIENLKELDEASKERLLYGNWEYDSDISTLIRYDKIIDVFSNSFITGGEKYITADIARKGKDNTVIMVWDGLRVDNIFVENGVLVNENVAKIKEIQSFYNVPNSNTIVDEDGIGGGVVDYLRCKGFVNNSTPLEPINAPYNEFGIRAKENFINLKSQCYFKLAKYINDGKIFVQTNNDSVKNLLIEELEQVKQHNMDKDGKKAVVPKDLVKAAIGRSPDYSDALMMRMFFEYTPKIVFADAEY